MNRNFILGFVALTIGLVSGCNSIEEASKETKSYENWIGFVGAKMANTIINNWFGIATLFWPWFLLRAGLQLIHPMGPYN